VIVRIHIIIAVSHSFFEIFLIDIFLVRLADEVVSSTVSESLGGVV
jgi:hypothetical protein